MAFTFQQGDRPLPGYTIQRGVGRGGFGEVYYATSDGGKEVAIKYLRENAQIELRGSTHCLNLKNPHLVAIHDIKQSESGDSFVIMEFVNGPSLRDLMTESPNGLGKDKAVFFLREIGKGLAYLHDRGLVHRDLKPGNIFYEDGYVKIGDYGLAKMMAASQHSGQTVSVGTVHYMAPEVGSGNYDRTIDIYALGVMLYEMLLGRVPFSGSSMGEVLMKHLTAQPEVDELPAPFPAVIRKALAKDPKDRYQTVNEMMDDVFAVEDINRSIASFDSLGLSRMAARVAERVRMDAGARVAVGVGGSSNAHRWAGPGAPTPPPPVISRDAMGDGGRGVLDRTGRRLKDLAYGEDGDKFLAIPDSQGFPQRDRVTTGLLGVCLGGFGVHRFYTGHNAIGVLQIVATVFTGIGMLWGTIEGIRILVGCEFLDSMGRPLRGSKPRDPLARSTILRGFWGMVGVVGVLAAIGLGLGGLFTPPEYENFGFGDDPPVYFNVYYFLLCGGCGAAALGSFGLWKAAHRGGMSAWRATIRPAVMCFAAALAGCAFVMQRLIVPATLQAPLIALIVIFLAAFFVLWLLRGNHLQLRASDVYWSRAWMRIFLLVTVLSGATALFAGSRWDDRGYEFQKADATPYHDVVLSENYRRYRFGYGSQQQIQVRGSVFNQEPILLYLAIGMALCAALEAWYRRSLIARAAEVASSSNALPHEVG